jgi:hypothetical protein
MDVQRKCGTEAPESSHDKSPSTPAKQLCDKVIKEDNCWCNCPSTKVGGVYCHRFETRPDPICMSCAYRPCQYPPIRL